jgi:hypothetical protein
MAWSSYNENLKFKFPNPSEPEEKLQLQNILKELDILL